MGSKFVFQAVWIVVAGYCTCRCIKSLAAIQRAGRFPPGSARLRVLGLRDDTAPIPSSTGPFFKAAGLLEDGCKLPVPEGRATLTLDHEGVFPLGRSQGYSNGYYFVMNSSNYAVDPVKWIVEVSDFNGSGWEQVGASVWRLTTTGSPLLFPMLAYPLAISSNNGESREVRVDCRPQLSWMLTTASEQLIFAIFYMIAAVAGLVGRADLIAPITVMTLSMNSLFIFSGISITEPSMWREAVRLASYAIGDAYLAFSAAREMNFIMAFTAGHVFIMASASIVEVVLYGRELNGVLLQQMLSLASFAGIFSLVAFSFRYSTLFRAHRLVLPDRRRYDALWNEALSDSNERKAMQAVCEQSAALLQGGRGMTAPRHRWPVASLCSALSSRFIREVTRIPGAWGESVTSLDQLFVQVL